MNDRVRNNLYIGNLAPQVDEKCLMDAFADLKPVERTVKVIRDHDSGASRGFGFVGFATVNECQAALDAMNGKALCDKELQISFAFKRKPRHDRNGSFGERSGYNNNHRSHQQHDNNNGIRQQQHQHQHQQKQQQQCSENNAKAPLMSPVHPQMLPNQQFMNNGGPGNFGLLPSPQMSYYGGFPEEYMQALIMANANGVNWQHQFMQQPMIPMAPQQHQQFIPYAPQNQGYGYSPEEIMALQQMSAWQQQQKQHQQASPPATSHV